MATQDNRLDGYTVLDGQFGTERPEIRMAFPYFGEVIRVHPNASDVEWMSFIDSMRGVSAEDIDGAEAMSATLDYIRGQIHPDDWGLFTKTATANRQNSMDLMAVAQHVLEAVAGFPTGQPSDSQPGQQLTGHLLKGGSQRPARTRRSKEELRAEATKRALLKAEDAGRADIALVLLENYEHQTGTKFDPESLTA